MYEAGYKQAMVWIARNPDEKDGRINRSTFIKRLDKLTEGWSAERLSKLFTVMLSMIEAKKEVKRRGNIK
jgi:hypothetical protein